MLTEIKKEEQVVISWLKSHGYYRVVAKPNHFIEADGKIRRMFVGVRTADSDGTIEESTKRLALTENREAWLAEVDPSDNDIVWRNLK